MRLIRLTTNYPGQLDALYRRNVGLAGAVYNEQYRCVVADGFGWADFWTHALSPLGYEVWEPIANAEPMQKAWASEHRVAFAETTWMLEITLAQARTFSPDVVFIDDYAAFDAAFIRELRQSVPSIRLMLGWCAAPYSDESVFAHYDLVMTSIPGVADHFRRKGLHAEVMGHAFDPRILERIRKQSAPDLPFVFIGSIRPGATHLLRRQSLVLQLARERGLAVFADLSLPSPQREPALRGILAAMLNRSNSAEEVDIHAWRAMAGEVRPARYGLEMFQTLRDSTLTFNSHSDFFGDWASNMRLYEATGVGVCLLTEWKQNLPSLFEPDREVAVYRSAAECLDKARWLLEHPRERETIAQAGQRRTLRDHTFQKRAEVLHGVIQRYAQCAA